MLCSRQWCPSLRIWRCELSVFHKCRLAAYLVSAGGRRMWIVSGEIIWIWNILGVALKHEPGKILYKPLRDNSFQILLACDFGACCSACLDLQKLHMQIWLFEDDFMSDFSMRAVPGLQKIWNFGFGVLSLFPSSAIILDLKLCSNTQTLCCLRWILFLLYLLSW